GSPDRFMAILIEHFAGNFPFWLSPVQVKVLPIAETHNEYAEKVISLLNEKHIRVEIDVSKDSFGKKVRNAKKDKVPYFLVIGDEEMNSEKVMLESRDGGKLGQCDLNELFEHLK